MIQFLSLDLIHLISGYLTKKADNNIVEHENLFVSNRDWNHFVSTSKICFREWRRKSVYYGFMKGLSKKYLTDTIFQMIVHKSIVNPHCQLGLYIIEHLGSVSERNKTDTKLLTNLQELATFTFYQTVIVFETNPIPLSIQLLRISANFLRFNRKLIVRHLDIWFEEDLFLNNEERSVESVDLSLIEGVQTLIISSISNDAFIELINYQHLTEITNLQLSNCTNIEDLRCWKKLKSLYLHECPDVKYFDFSKTQLEYLNILKCPNLSEEILFHEMAMKQPFTLKSITLSSIQKLSIVSNYPSFSSIVSLSILLPSHNDEEQLHMSSYWNPNFLVFFPQLENLFVRNISLPIFFCNLSKLKILSIFACQKANDFTGLFQLKELTISCLTYRFGNNGNNNTIENSDINDELNIGWDDLISLKYLILDNKIINLPMQTFLKNKACRHSSSLTSISLQTIPLSVSFGKLPTKKDLPILIHQLFSLFDHIQELSLKQMNFPDFPFECFHQLKSLRIHFNSMLPSIVIPGTVQRLFLSNLEELTSIEVLDSNISRKPSSSSSCIEKITIRNCWKLHQLSIHRDEISEIEIDHCARLNEDQIVCSRGFTSVKFFKKK
jgi:hypothetical protein